jgi:pyruvate/2-oxoglutarate/acetoin dehydrogenase E1 component
MRDSVLSFTDAIKEATGQAMERHSNAHMLGLGVTYPNGADGTTGGLLERFPGRVHDIPCSENAITGMSVGMAACGLRPIVHHGRIEFAFYAVDPILTQAANWNYMFGGGYPCPLTLRVALGRQWGNGPQHTRSGRSFFAVPGLQVVVPSTPDAAKGLLLAAVDEDNPVIYLEHRWLYKLKGQVSQEPLPMALGKARVLRMGNAVTIVAVGDMVLEALKAADLMINLYGIRAEVVDLVSIYPMDFQTISNSVGRTRRVLAVDAATPAFSTAHEIIGRLALEGVVPMQPKTARVLTCPDVPCPTATSLTAGYYPTHIDIMREVCGMIDIPWHEPTPMNFPELHLAPGINVSALIEAEAVPA